MLYIAFFTICTLILSNIDSILRLLNTILHSFTGVYEKENNLMTDHFVSILEGAK